MFNPEDLVPGQIVTIRYFSRDGKLVRRHDGREDESNVEQWIVDFGTWQGVFFRHEFLIKR